MALNRGPVDLILTLQVSIIYSNCTMCGFKIKNLIFLWFFSKDIHIFTFKFIEQSQYCRSWTTDRNLKIVKILSTGLKKKQK